MSRRRRLLGLYAGVARTYWSWAPVLLLLATIVFVPLGLLDALLHEVDTSALNVTGGLRLVALLGAAAAVTASSLFGEVFFSGAIATSLTRGEDEAPPSFLEIARHISYGTLIAVDILYVLATVVGMVLLIVPGVLALVYLSLAGAAVELEKLGVWAGFRRSVQLVRGHFWMVAAVVVPTEIVGDAINEALVAGVHHLLGESLLAAWLGEAIGNIVTAPPIAVAFVLLTLELIRHHDGSAPTLKRRPEPVVAEAG